MKMKAELEVGLEKRLMLKNIFGWKELIHKGESRNLYIATVDINKLQADDF